MLRDIFDVSQECSTNTYLWGGIVIDILEGRFLREHHDLDGFTLNFRDVLDEMQSLFEQRGYLPEYDDKFQILKIEKDGSHATFNGLEVDGEIAMWRHVGNDGTIFFPEEWLDKKPRAFYSVKALTSGIKFEYAIKKNVKLLSPEWEPREKDAIAIEYYDKALHAEGMSREDVLSQIWSYTPYWNNKGYPQYSLPSTEWPSEPR